MDRDTIEVDPSNLVAPFPIKRVYYIFGTKPGIVRGKHAHKKLRQLAFCPIGSCVIDFDDRIRRWSVKLDSPTKGVMIEPGAYHEMRDFTPDCVMTVLADAPYDEMDYIRDWN